MQSIEPVDFQAARRLIRKGAVEEGWQVQGEFQAERARMDLFGNGVHQEIGRNKKPHQTKFWHRDVPDRLRKILDAGKPEQYGIKEKAVLTIFRKWQECRAAEEMPHVTTNDSTAH